MSGAALQRSGFVGWGELANPTTDQRIPMRAICFASVKRWGSRSLSPTYQALVGCNKAAGRIAPNGLHAAQCPSVIAPYVDSRFLRHFIRRNALRLLRPT